IGPVVPIFWNNTLHIGLIKGKQEVPTVIPSTEGNAMAYSGTCSKEVFVVVFDRGKWNHPGTTGNMVSVFIFIILTGFDHPAIKSKNPGHVFQGPKGSIGKPTNPKLILKLRHIGYGFCLKRGVILHGKFSLSPFGGNHDYPIGGIRTIKCGSVRPFKDTDIFNIIRVVSVKSVP